MRPRHLGRRIMTGLNYLAKDFYTLE